jgi:hypothetical protein
VEGVITSMFALQVAPEGTPEFLQVRQAIEAALAKLEGLAEPAPAPAPEQPPSAQWLREQAEHQQSTLSMLRQSGLPEGELAVLVQGVEAATLAAQEAQAAEERQQQTVLSARTAEKQAQERVAEGATFQQFCVMVGQARGEELPQDELWELFAEMDTDASGTISAMEFAAFSAKGLQGRRPQQRSRDAPAAARAPRKAKAGAAGVAEGLPPARPRESSAAAQRRQHQMYKTRLQGIWRQHGATTDRKTGLPKDADALLRKHAGKEEELLAQVEERYARGGGGGGGGGRRSRGGHGRRSNGDAPAAGRSRRRTGEHAHAAK